MKQPAWLFFFASIIVALSYAAFRGGFPAPPEASKSTLTWHNFDEGIALATKEKRKILIDVFTDWCVWCKKMDSEVYSSEVVTSALNKNFILVKLDAESEHKLTYNGKQYTEREFARSLGINGYPTTVFFQSDAQPLTSLPGFVESTRFSAILNYIGDDHYKTSSFEQYLTNSGKNQ